MSRLRKIASELNNKQWDIENLYGQIVDQLEQIRNEVSEMNDTLSKGQYEDFIENVDYLSKGIDNIVNSTDFVIKFSEECLKIGQDNEDVLKEGNEIIKDLERELNDLQYEIESMLSNNSLLEDELSELMGQINIVENLLTEIDSEQNTTASINKKLVKSSASYPWICAVHEKMMENASDIADIKKFKKMFDKVLNAKEEKQQEMFTKLLSIFSEEYEKIISIIDSYEEDMNIGSNMNGRMGNGIDMKNERINELKTQLETLANELNDLSTNHQDLNDNVANLQNKLNELNALL